MYKKFAKEKNLTEPQSMQRERTRERLGSESLAESFIGTSPGEKSVTKGNNHPVAMDDANLVAMGDKPAFKVIPDRFEKLSEVRKEIRKCVDAEIGLIFGIDYTLSNFKQGQRTFGGKSLHTVEEGCVNPYQEVICIMGETLEEFDSDGIIPAYGFGDYKVKDKGIFPLKQEGECEGFLEVLEVYKTVTSNIKLGNPTNFAPLIREAISIVKKTKQFHVLIIVADGQVNEEEDTVAAIVEASNYPLSIVVIGVGDGPWEEMKEFDDKLPERRFDNFQFVDFYKTKTTARNPETAVALAALMEIPDQYKAIKEQGLYENC